MYEDTEFNQVADTENDMGSDETTNQEVGDNLDGDFDNSDDGVAEHLRVKEEPTEESKEEEHTEEKTEEESVKEESKEEFPDREIEEVEKEYNRLVQDGVNDFISLQKSFLAVAKAPEGIGYTAEQAFQYGIENSINPDGTVNIHAYDPFLECLSPLEVKRFIQEKGELDTK